MEEIMNSGVSLLIPMIIMSAFVSPARSDDVRPDRQWERDRQSSRDEGIVRERTLKILYHQMVHLTYPERSLLLRSQLVAVRAALWNYHFDRFVSNNPNLTDAQLGVIAYARKLVGNLKWLAIEPEAPGWEKKKVDLFTLESMAQGAFTADVIETVFLSVGPPYVPLPDAPFVPGTMECDCSVNSDYCVGSVCVEGASTARCYVVPGCGWMFQWSCDGTCHDFREAPPLR
jgi:hypothetical protein